MTLRMEFAFSCDRTAQAAAWLLNNSPRPVTKLELLKWLYFADRQLLSEVGTPLTGDKLVSLKHGPAPSKTYDLIKGQLAGTPEQATWDEYVKHYPGDPNVLQAVRTGKDTYDDLTPREIKTLGAVLAKFVNLSVSDLVDLSHSLAEWEDPEGSSKEINPVRILEVEHWNREDIQMAARNAEANRAIDELMGSC